MIIDGAVPIASGGRSSVGDKSDLPKFYPGLRRSFFCRMKTKAGSFNGNSNFGDSPLISDNSCINNPASALKGNTFSFASPRKVYSTAYVSSRNSERYYQIVQCTGYLRSWAPPRACIKEEPACHSMDPTDLLLGRRNSIPADRGKIHNTGKFQKCISKRDYGFTWQNLIGL